MAVKFEFYLSDEDTERLFAVKEDKGKEERELYRLHPNRVKYDDETGERIE